MTTLRPPHPVRLAARLLLGVAALGVLMALAAIVSLIHLADAKGAYEQAVGLEGDDDVVYNVVWSLGYGLCVALAVALAGAFLANKIRFPSQAAQMSSLVFAGMAVLAVGCGLVGDPAALTGRTTGASEVTRLQAALVPGWYTSVNTLLALALLAGVLAQAVLLFRPAAQNFHHLGDWEEAPAAREGL
jgi:hypothetical protein